MSDQPRTQEERAVLARHVIGEERREQLIARCADGIRIRWGMTEDAARRHAESSVNDAAPAAVLRPGQVWKDPEDGAEYPVKAVGRLVETGRSLLAPSEFSRYLLVSWPEECPVDVPPQPPSDPVPHLVVEEGGPEDDGEEPEEEGLDPRFLGVLARRAKDKPEPHFHYLPLINPFYRTVNLHKEEYAPSYANGLDVPAYLREHLADYRAGWQDFRDAWAREDASDYFNVMDGGCDCPVAVAAYLGHWLYQRVRSDVVAEYGGTVKDYSVTFDWGPGDADTVLAAAPYADPEWELPADHPLAQCAGQQPLIP